MEGRLRVKPKTGGKISPDPFYDCETQDLGDICLLSLFLYGCLGFVNHPSIRAIMRTIAFDLGS